MIRVSFSLLWNFKVDPNNSPFRERGDVAAIRTPAGIKQAWQQAIREQKLLNRIIKISELSKVWLIEHDSGDNTFMLDGEYARNANVNCWIMGRFA